MPPAAPPRVLAVDGNSLGHRGFHSVRQEAEAQGWTAPFVTGAVVGMLASAWIEGPYDAVVIGFDHPINQRKLDVPEYKANRAATHPDLPGHLQALRGHLADCGFGVVEIEGAEADDLLAAAVAACEARGWSCDVLSSDRDLTTLVSPTTRLLRPRATFADLKVYDEVAVRAEYGVAPWQYTDLAALRGDPSDGLLGATGIGPKMAARLLRDYGSIDGMYAELHNLAPKVEAALRASRDRVMRNLRLMRPIPDLPVDVEAAVAAGVDHARVETTLDGLGLYAPARRFVRAVTAPPPPPMPPLPPEPDELVGVGAPVGATPVITSPTSGEQASLF